MKKITSLFIFCILFVYISCTGVVNPAFLVEKQLPNPILAVVGYDSATDQLTVSATLSEDLLDSESGFSYNWLVDDVAVEADGDTLTYTVSGDQLTYNITCFFSKTGRDDSDPVSADVNLIALVPSLRLWLDGADETSFTYDADKKISKWADKSGFGNDADQVELTSSPMFVDLIQNDNSIVRFDGIDDHFRDVFTIPTSNMTIFSVFSHKHSTVEAAKGPLWQTNGYAAASGFYPYYETRQRVATSNSAWLEESSRFRSDSWHLAEIVYGINSVELYKNGVVDSSASLNTVDNGGFQIAKSTLNEYFKGDIGEILFFNGSLTSSLTAKVQNYLMAKWGISQTQSILEPEISVLEQSTEYFASQTYTMATVSSSSLPTVFTLENSGTADLLVSQISISGASYVLDQTYTNITIPAGGSSDFTVVFTPLSAGSYDGIVSIQNSDYDESYFVLNLSGTATAFPEPEILLRRGANDVLSGSSYDFASQVQNSGSKTVTFIILNTGTGDLDITGISVDDSVNYTVDSVDTLTTVPAGNSTTFDVIFAPLSTGDLDATLTLANNDDDESNYYVALTGQGTVSPEPEIIVKSIDGNTLYPSNGTGYGFGSQISGSVSSPATFMIHNEGTTTLLITSVSINDTTNYNLINSLDGVSITAGNSAGFSLAYMPQAVGTHAAEVTIANNDSDEASYVLNITGEGTAAPQPEISVLQAGGDYTSNTTVYDYGDVLANPTTPPQVVFEIKNTGTADLSISGIVLNDLTNYSFADGTTSATLVSGQSMYKTITFDPLSTGIMNAELSIYSTDSDENPFILKITGTGVVPEITITESAVEYFNNGTAFDFSYQKLSTTSGVKTFTVENTGTYDLTVNSVVLSTGVSNYSLTGPATPLVLIPAETETFTVTFTPISEQVHTGTIIIGNTDPDRSSFTLNLTGEGDTGELTVLQAAAEYFDDNSPFYFDVTAAAAGANNKTFTVRNDGNVDLVISSFTGPAAPFATTAVPVTLTGGQQTTFDISFDPDTAGGYDGTLVINSDDVDEGAFSLNLRGGTTAPDLAGDLFVWLNAEDIRVGTDTVNELDQINGGMKDYVFRWPDMSTGAIGELSSLNAVESTTEVNGANAHKRRLPEFQASVPELNGQPALRFRDDDGLPESTSTAGDDAPYYNGDVLRILGSTTYYDDFTILIVMRPADFIDSAGRTYYYGNSGGVYFRVYDSTTDFYNNINGTVVYYSDMNLELSKTFLISNRWRKWPADPAFDSTESYRFWANGTEEIDTAPSPVQSYTNQIVTTTRRLYATTIGNHVNNFRTYGFDGYIPEIIVYNSALPDEAITIIHDYLNTKYTIWP
jgi:hypothetical protein